MPRNGNCLTEKALNEFLADRKLAEEYRENWSSLGAVAQRVFELREKWPGELLHGIHTKYGILFLGHPSENKQLQEALKLAEALRKCELIAACAITPGDRVGINKNGHVYGHRMRSGYNNQFEHEFRKRSERVLGRSCTLEEIRNALALDKRVRNEIKPIAGILDDCNVSNETKRELGLNAILRIIASVEELMK